MGKLKVASPDENVLLEGVKIRYANFSGKEGPYNQEGNRNFAAVIDDETAEKLLKGGWNVKTRLPREEGDVGFHYLPISVSYKFREPRVVLITSRGRTPLTEDLIGMIDYAELEKVDLIVRPYDWALGGKSGRKAYLKTGFFIIAEDYLERKYRDIPEIGSSRMEIASGEEEFIDGEIVDEYDEIDSKVSRLALPPGKDSEE